MKTDRSRQNGSQEMMRQTNVRLVLRTIREEEPISRAQIAGRLSLSRSTVSQIADELLAKGLIYETGSEERTLQRGGGRPGQMLRFHAGAAVIAAVQMTYQGTVIRLTDLKGANCLQMEYEAALDAETLALYIRKTLQQASFSEEKLQRISISVPGTVNREGKVRANRLRWRQYALGPLLEKCFSCPIDIQNDVKLALLGERRFGIGGGGSDLVYIHLGKGIGCGILCGGNVVMGTDCTAGELGLMIRDNGDPDLTALPRLEGELSSGQFVDFPDGFAGAVAGYTRGDPESVGRIEPFIRTLSVTIANLIGLFNPEMVILGGPMSACMDDLLEDIRNMTDRLCWQKTEIQLGSLRGNAPVMGAAAFALDRMILE